MFICSYAVLGGCQEEPQHMSDCRVAENVQDNIEISEVAYIISDDHGINISFDRETPRHCRFRLEFSINLQGAFIDNFDILMRSGRNDTYLIVDATGFFGINGQERIFYLTSYTVVGEVPRLRNSGQNS